MLRCELNVHRVTNWFPQVWVPHGRNMLNFHVTPRFPALNRFTKLAPEPPAFKSPSPPGAPDVVLSDHLGNSRLMGGRKLLLGIRLLWY